MSMFGWISTAALFVVIDCALFAYYWWERWRESRRPSPPVLPASPADQEFDPLLRVDAILDPCLPLVRRERPVWPDDAMPIWEDQSPEPIALVTRAGVVVDCRPAEETWPNLEPA